MWLDIKLLSSFLTAEEIQCCQLVTFNTPKLFSAAFAFVGITRFSVMTINIFTGGIEHNSDFKSHTDAAEELFQLQS